MMRPAAALACLRDKAPNWTSAAMSLVFLVNLLIMWRTETVPAVEGALPDVDVSALALLAGSLAVLFLACSRQRVQEQPA